MDELGQITLTQLAGIGMSILLTLALVAMWKIGIPLASEWWQRRRVRRLSTDSRETATLEHATAAPTLRRAAVGSGADLLPTLLVLLAIQARKTAEAGGGKERGQEIEREMRDITREYAHAELSKRADTALLKYARTGKIDTDTDVYALLGVKTEAGQRRLKAIREQLTAVAQAANAATTEDATLAAQVARVKALPRDPELERMIPLPT